MAQAGFKRYPVEKGKIVYQTGEGEFKKTETVYFDRWGWRELRIVEQLVIRSGNKIDEKRGILMDGEFTYNLDYNFLKGSKTFSLIDVDLSETIKGLALSEKGEKMLTQNGAKALGSATLLDKACNGYEFANGVKSWFWKGMLLKSENGGTLTKCLSFDTDSDFDTSIFKIPSSFQIMDLGTMPVPKR